MEGIALDHLVIHVDDWDACQRFYEGVLGLERLANPEGAANPLGSWAYRAGGQQVNVHGPWPGQEGACCPAPWNEVGGADLAFRVTARSVEETQQRLEGHGIAVIAGPARRFGAWGWGMSVYCHDPCGNGIELIHYP